MKLIFLNLSALNFTVATPDTQPLGGSESCVCYLARQLGQDGHDVSLMARLPTETASHIHGVHHAALDRLKDQSFFDDARFDVIVAVNAPVAIPHLRQISPQSRLVLWDHVPPEQPSMAQLAHPEILQTLDKIVYVSEWQKQKTEQYFGIAAPHAIIGNGLTPAFENMFASAQNLLAHKQNRAAYTTIPYRGLPLLLEAMKGIAHDTKLDIFSSMKLYQMPDDEYAGLYRQAEQDKRITSHGVVPQTQLAQHLKSAAFLAYPCICEETFCIAALEAMAAGLKVISTKLGALPTTTMGFADLLPVTSTNPDDIIAAFRQSFDDNIRGFLSAREEWAERMFAQSRAVNEKSTWKVRATEWIKLFETLKIKN